MRRPGTVGRLRILIIDDNVDYAQGIATLLRSWGYCVELAHNAHAARAIAAELRPRVILLDLGLPDMHGYALAKQLREQAGARKLYFIVATGWMQVADQISSSAAGISHHLVKPINFDILREIIAAYQAAEEATLAAQASIV